MKMSEKDTRIAVPPQGPRPDPPGNPLSDSSYSTMMEKVDGNKWGCKSENCYESCDSHPCLIELYYSSQPTVKEEG